MAKRQSLAEVTAERDTLNDRQHILGVAFMDQPEAIFRYRDNRDVYIWRAYRLTGPVGGYVVGVFDGFANGRPSILYVGHLDTMNDSVRHRGSSLMDIGMTQAAERFTRARHDLLNPTAKTA